MNLTLGEASPLLAITLQVCADDARIARYVNRATERLMYLGKWNGTMARYNINLINGLLTLPTELETCLAASLCQAPMRVRNEWFQYIASGPGPDGCCGGFRTLQDMGDGYVTLGDIGPTPMALRVYCDVLEDGAAEITIMGYDENINPVRTSPGGTWQDGETLLLNPVSPAIYQTSAFTWSGIAQIVKPTTNGNVRLYAVDTLGNQTLLGIYGPNIRLPKFRRYATGGFNGDGSTIAQTLFTRCKRRFIPVTDPNDLLIIPNLSALEDAVKGIQLREAGDFATGDGLINNAATLLNRELDEHGEGAGGQMDIEVLSHGHSGVPALL